MRRLLLTLAMTLPLAAPAQAEKPRKPKPALTAAEYPLHQTHDKVTIAAEPGDTKETEPNTRLDYAHHGFMPFRVIVTNDSDAAISLDDARIKFISSDDHVVQAADDDELQRRLFSRKYVSDSHIPMPAPFPSIPIHHKPVDKQILLDDADFGFPTTTVAAHATVSGYLYYDTRDLDDPVLDHATLEVRKVRIASSNKELDSFEIALKSTPIAPKSGGPSTSGGPSSVTAPSSPKAGSAPKD
ncbi:MAG: hypothetical protein ABI147_04705 [Acidobacteriaceae bacterium]